MKKHYALYRDGLLLIRTKTRAKIIKVQNEFIHTGKTFEIREEEHISGQEGFKALQSGISSYKAGTATFLRETR